MLTDCLVIASIIQMSEIKSELSNLQLSSETIVFARETQSGELTIANLHHSYSVCWKIKTKIEKLFEVKPTKGLIKPGEKVKIAFKAFKKIEDAEQEKFEKELKFLLQAVNRTSSAITKEEEENLWRQIKEKTADISLGYCAVKISIDFSGNPNKAKEVIPSFTLFDSKLSNQFASEIKTSKKNPTMSDIAPNQRFSHEEGPILSETEMSKKYEHLKEKEQQLIKQREKVLVTTDGTAKPKGGNKSTIILIVLLALAFLLGNYLKTTLSPQQQPQKEEKGFFSFF